MVTEILVIGIEILTTVILGIGVINSHGAGIENNLRDNSLRGLDPLTEVVRIINCQTKDRMNGPLTVHLSRGDLAHHQLTDSSLSTDRRGFTQRRWDNPAFSGPRQQRNYYNPNSERERPPIGCHVCGLPICQSQFHRRNGQVAYRVWLFCLWSSKMSLEKSRQWSTSGHDKLE